MALLDESKRVTAWLHEVYEDEDIGLLLGVKRLAKVRVAKRTRDPETGLFLFDIVLAVDYDRRDFFWSKTFFLVLTFCDGEDRLLELCNSDYNPTEAPAEGQIRPISRELVRRIFI